jgi:hypothetical protein
MMLSVTRGGGLRAGRRANVVLSEKAKGLGFAPLQQLTPLSVRDQFHDAKSRRAGCPDARADEVSMRGVQQSQQFRGYSYKQRLNSFILQSSGTRTWFLATAPALGSTCFGRSCVPAMTIAQ